MQSATIIPLPQFRLKRRVFQFKPIMVMTIMASIANLAIAQSSEPLACKGSVYNKTTGDYETVYGKTPNEIFSKWENPYVTTSSKTIGDMTTTSTTTYTYSLGGFVAIAPNIGHYPINLSAEVCFLIKSDSPIINPKPICTFSESPGASGISCDYTNKTALILSPDPAQINNGKIRPLGSEGSTDKKLSQQIFIARLIEKGNPKAGATIEFKNIIETDSGGHKNSNHTGTRPTGTLSASIVKTDAKGEAKVVFTAPEFAGVHIIKATCTSCLEPKPSEQLRIEVKVPGLTQITDDPRYRFISEDPEHGNSNNAIPSGRATYYISAEGKPALNDFVNYMINTNLLEDTGGKLYWSKPIGLNDISLKWGGRFDINHNWKDSHKEHRLGVQIDIQTKFQSIDVKKRMYEHICQPKDSKFPLASKILWHQGTVKIRNKQGQLVSLVPEHFHVHLLGDKVSTVLGGGVCKITGA